METEIDDMLAQTSQALAQGRKDVALVLAAVIARDVCDYPNPLEPFWSLAGQAVVQTAVLLAAECNERPTLAHVQMRLTQMDERVALSTSPAVHQVWGSYEHLTPDARKSAMTVASTCLAQAIRFDGPAQARRDGLVQAVQTASQALNDFDQAHGL